MAKIKWKCPDCGSEDYDIEQDWEDDEDGVAELMAEDKVCDNCGYRETIF